MPAGGVQPVRIMPERFWKGLCLPPGGAFFRLVIIEKSCWELFGALLGGLLYTQVWMPRFLNSRHATRLDATSRSDMESDSGSDLQCTR